MKKDEYIKKELFDLNHKYLPLLFLFGATVDVALSLLDYLVTPDNFVKFLIIRSITAAITIVLAVSVRLRSASRFDTSALLVATFITASMIEAMILSFGGHQSSYYAGLILIMIFVFAFLPISVKMTTIINAIIYAVYLVPILALDPITNPKIFISNNAFLLAAFSGSIAWRHINYTLLVNKLSLQYDTEQQKKQLETYSHRLEEMVAERTKELHKSEQWHRSLFENATDGVVVLNREGIIVNVNDKVCEMHDFPRDVLVGTHIKLLEAESDRELQAERMARILAGEALIYETVHNKKDGSPLHLEISSKMIIIGEELWIQSFYRDITEKKKLREHLFQSQKMESIGVLAGGIAHDFNNMLTAVLGHTEVIRYHSSLDSKALRSLQVIEDASRKAGGMISQLLGFARKSSFQVMPVNMNDVVQDTLKLLERVIEKNILIKLELAESLPFIEGDVNQLSQVIMNLIVNARDAMPHGGRIVITTQYREVAPGIPGMPAYILPGEYIHLSIADTGSGIPDHIVQKIFEPFFTTKDRGKGTGLGLSMAYGAVKEHRGYITVESRLGAGTTFNVLLPLARVKTLESEEKPQVSVNGTETIMFVDDEEHVLSAVQETLTSHGYTVIAISDPAQAVERFKERSQDIALVITDMVMPKLEGQDLIRQLRVIRPEIKILAVSGYVKYVSKNEDIREIAGFLQKPFESRQLLTTVRRILDPISKPPINA